MADTALQQTVNRGVALIVLLLSALVLGFENWVWSDVYGASPPGAFGRFAYVAVPMVLFGGALVYLAVSTARGVTAGSDAETAT